MSVWVSITGLRVRRIWHYPDFLRHALPAMAQARGADGNLRAEARTIRGVHHTLSVWRDRSAMRAYLVSGAHGEAMKVFDRIAEGHTFGYETDTVPSWSEIPALWDAHRPDARE